MVSNTWAAEKIPLRGGGGGGGGGVCIRISKSCKATCDFLGVVQTPPPPLKKQAASSGDIAR